MDMRHRSAALAALDWTLRLQNSPMKCRVGCVETAVIFWEWRAPCFKRHRYDCEFAPTDAKLRSNRTSLASRIRPHSAADCALLLTRSSMTARWIAFWSRKWGA